MTKVLISLAGLIGASAIALAIYFFGDIWIRRSNLNEALDRIEQRHSETKAGAFAVKYFNECIADGHNVTATCAKGVIAAADALEGKKFASDVAISLRLFIGARTDAIASHTQDEQ